MASYYGKTAKMWVKELCEQQGGKVEYCTYPQNPEILHGPDFITSCTVTYTDVELMAPGQGSQEIEAEQMAATAMLFESMGFTTTKLCALKENRSISSLDKFINVNKNGKLPIIPQEKTNHKGSISDTDDKEIEGINPKGALQEACARRKIPLPEYEEVAIDGPSHQPMFTIKCTVGKIAETAKRGTKKKAQAIVAFRVLRKLKAIKFNVSGSNETDDVNKCIPNTDEIPGTSHLVDGDKNGDGDLMSLLANQMSLKENIACTTRMEFITIFKDVITKFVSTMDEQERGQEDVSTANNPLQFLHDVCQQSGITLTLHDLLILPASTGKYYHAVLKIKYPFPEYSPAFSVVEGKGKEERLAVSQCAVEALKIIHAQFLR